MKNFIIQIFTIVLFFTVLAKSESFDIVLIEGNERISDETILVFSDLPN